MKESRQRQADNILYWELTASKYSVGSLPVPRGTNHQLCGNDDDIDASVWQKRGRYGYPVRSWLATDFRVGYTLPSTSSAPGAKADYQLLKADALRNFEAEKACLACQLS